MTPDLIATAMADIVSAKNLDETVNTATNIFNELGFNSWYCLPLPSGHFSNNDLQFLEGNFNLGWKDFYIKNDLRNNDSVLRYILKSRVPFTFNSIYFDKISEEEKEVHRHALAFGIADGIAFPIHKSGGYFAAFIISSKNNLDLNPDEISLISAFVNIIHDKIYSFKHEEICKLNHIKQLSARERDVLVWVLEGKSNKEIADIIGISENTVKYHIKHACNRLGVVSRVQAAVRALVQGLLK